MRKPFSPLGEWFRILTSEFSGYPVSSVHILQHLSFCVYEGISGMRHPLLSIDRYRMIVFTMVYLLLETLEPVLHGVRVIICYV